MGGCPPELDCIPISEIADALGVSLKTARRYKKGTSCPSKTDLAIITGDLSVFGPEWRGWKIRGLQIISPDGWTISRNDALAVPLMHGQIAALRQDLTRARQALEAAEYEEQPLPTQWVAEGF